MSAATTQRPTAVRKLLDAARQQHLQAIQRAVEAGTSRTELLTDLDAFACAADQIVAMGQ